MVSTIFVKNSQKKLVTHAVSMLEYKSGTNHNNIKEIFITTYITIPNQFSLPLIVS